MSRWEGSWPEKRPEIGREDRKSLMHLLHLWSNSWSPIPPPLILTHVISYIQGLRLILIFYQKKKTFTLLSPRHFYRSKKKNKKPGFSHRHFCHFSPWVAFSSAPLSPSTLSSTFLLYFLQWWLQKRQALGVSVLHLGLLRVNCNLLLIT